MKGLMQGGIGDEKQKVEEIFILEDEYLKKY